MDNKIQLFEGIDLNRRQQKAVTFPFGVHCVVAGAGTGKTRVLTLRIVYLIKQFGLLASNILAITFTKKAAQEIAKRIKQYINVTDLKWIRTIHSFCSAFLREEIRHIGRSPYFDVVTDGDREHIIKELCYKNNIDQELIDRDQLTNAIWNQKIINWSLDPSLKRVDKISSQNQNTDVSNPLIQNVSDLYNQRLAEGNELDFDDLLILTYKILKQSPDVRSKWQDLFDYILVDEFQDIDEIQYQIITMLAQKNNRLFAVGDSDQSIYAWRGAVPNIERRLKQDFPKAKILLLKQNYRCSKKILRVANKLIKHNSGRMRKKLFSEIKFKDKVIYYHATSQQNEAQWIVNRIGALLNDSEKKFQFSDIAIIYRKGFWLKYIEEELVKRNWHYLIYSGKNFYQRKEIQDMIAYIGAVILKDDDSIYQIINTPARDIDENSLTIIEEFVESHDCSLYEALVNHNQIIRLNLSAHRGIVNFLKTLETIRTQSQLKFDRIINTILTATEYEKTFKSPDDPRRERLNLLIQAMNNYHLENPEKDLLDFINEFFPLTCFRDPKKNEPKNVIKLMTIHSAKGLEFPCVFVVGLVEGILPDWRSINLSNNEINADALKEERRLLYVALTRAKQHLYLTSCAGTHLKTGAPMQISRFIKEIINAGLSWRKR